MSGIAQGILQDLALDKFNTTAQGKIAQKDPYSLPIPQGLSKRDADILRKCKRRAHQLDHNAVLCYCCPCFFGLNTAICLIPVLGPIWANSLSGRVIRMAEEADIPATLTAKMTANITFDFLITLPPFIGALFEVPPVPYASNNSGCTAAIQEYPLVPLPPFPLCPRCADENVALLDSYLRQRAADNLSKNRPGQSEVITQQPPSQGVETRFTDVSVEAEPVQPPPPQQQPQMQTGRGILGFGGQSTGAGKVPKKGRSGEQEVGVV